MTGADEVANERVIDEIEMTVKPTHSDATGGPSVGSDRVGLSAHIRTAVMLFVVTVVFVLTFAPAFLMSLEVVPYSRLVFNIYFFNNVANPVIYSFMNSYFRRELYPMFCQA